LVTLDEAVTARLKAHGANFEVLVDPDGAYVFRKGEAAIEDVLAVEDVFENASRGERPAEEDLVVTFGTTDVLQIAAKIVKDGEIHLTTEQRRRIQEQKKKKVIAIIARNAINPQTKTPHPPERIERAMEEAGVHIDALKHVDEQVNMVMKALRPIIPIRFEEINIAVKVPPDYAAKVYGAVSGFGKIGKQEWQSDGSWIGVITMPAGLQDDFYETLNRLTKGEAETKIVK
jgi:ribosome maturation protein SDO1